MYCPQCGAENTAAAKFCTTCGAPQKAICAVERAPAAQKVVLGASPEVCEKNSVNTEKSVGGGPRFPKRKTLVLCLCAILCLIAIGSAALLLRPKNSLYGFVHKFVSLMPAVKQAYKTIFMMIWETQ